MAVKFIKLNNPPIRALSSDAALTPGDQILVLEASGKPVTVMVGDLVPPARPDEFVYYMAFCPEAAPKATRPRPTPYDIIPHGHQIGVRVPLTQAWALAAWELHAHYSQETGVWWFKPDQITSVREICRQLYDTPEAQLA